MTPLQTFHEYAAAKRVVADLELRRKIHKCLSKKDYTELIELRCRITKYETKPTPPNTEQPPLGNSDNPNHARSEHDYTHESVNQK